MYKRFIPFILFAWCGLVSAATPMYSTSVGGFGATAQAACQAKVTAGYTYSSATSGSCWGSIPAQGTYAYASYALVQMADCPSGQVYNNLGKCDAPPPRTPTCNTPAGGTESWTQKTGHSKDANAKESDGDGGPYPTSSPNCGLSGQPDVTDCFSKAAAGGGADFFCNFKGKSSGVNAPVGTAAGESVSGAGGKPVNAPETPANPQGDCPGGMVQGGVDRSGIPICMGSGTSPKSSTGAGAKNDARPTASSTTKTTDSSGNEISVTKDTRQNEDGSTTTTTTTTTTAPGGASSSTSTTQTGNTPGGMQGQPDPPESDMCKLHPELTVCKNSSVSGSCGTIACQGDAIQCATLQQAAALRCKADDDDKAIKSSGAFSLGQAAMSGSDPLASTMPKPSNGTNVNVQSSLNTGGWLGGGKCFSDKTLSVFGQSVTLPFSQACDGLIILRYALMIVASLVSFRILRGTFLTE